MSNLDSMSLSFKQTAELQEFCDSQQKLIIDLTKKVTLLEKEKDHLKNMLESTIPVFSTITISDEEQIAREQLRKLNTLSKERDLTLEEAKRTDIYSKILLSLMSKNKQIETSAKHLSDVELLQLVSKE